MSWSLPITTEWMKSQSTHTPSMEYAKDIYKTVSEHQYYIPKQVAALEIGMAWGFSTLAILEAGVKSLLSIDPNHLAKGHDEAIANGYDNHVWNACKSDVFWKENPDVRFDIIYVDGSHLYDDVHLDLFEAWKRLNNNGLLMIDDWEHHNNIKADPNSGQSEYGVSLACWELFADKQEEVFDVGINGRVLWFTKV